MAVADRGKEGDGIRAQPPRDKREHLGAGPIEPLRVVDNDEDRARLRHICQKIQRCQRDQVRVGALLVRNPEGRANCIALRAG